jgi:cysteine-rich repeat protein
MTDRIIALLFSLTLILAACGGTDELPIRETTDESEDNDQFRELDDNGTGEETEGAGEEVGEGEDEEEVIPEEEEEEQPEENPGFETEPNDSLDIANPLIVVVGAQTTVAARMLPGDIDYFEITVDEPLELTVWTSDGAGGCNVDTTLAVKDAFGNQLGYNDDGGNYPCSRLEAIFLDGPASYFLVVEGFFSDQTGDYALHVTLLAPICGDGTLSAGEECDDGAFENGDGCDSECLIEAMSEEEPNNRMPDANEFDIGTTEPVLLRAEIASVDDIDMFAFEMGDGDSFTRIDVLPAGRTCSFEARIELVDSDGSVLAEDSYGYSACASLTYDMGIENLTEGTYYVRVTSISRTGSYLLNLVVREAVCGNGIREGSETCDDADDESSDDGCHECNLDADLEIEPNDRRGNAQDLGTFESNGGTAVFGEIAEGDNDFFSIRVADEARLEVWTDDGGSGCDFDTYIEVMRNSGDAFATNDDGGESVCSRLDKSSPEMDGLDGGKYVILVRGFSDYSDGVYVLHINVRYPTCGDGIVEGAEICDDANERNGDGCSRACLPEGIDESESNDEVGDALVLDLSGDDELLIAGNIDRAGDVDFFSVTVEDGAQLGAMLWNGSGGCSVNARVSLRSDASTVVRAGASLAADEGCWQVGGVADPYPESGGLDADTYLLRVTGRSSATGAYQLVVWVD